MITWENLEILDIFYGCKPIHLDINESPGHMKAYPQSQEELIEADTATSILIKAGKQLVLLIFTHVETILPQTILQLLAVQHSTPIVIVRLKHSKQKTNRPTINNPIFNIQQKQSLHCIFYPAIGFRTGMFTITMAMSCGFNCFTSFLEDRCVNAMLNHMKNWSP